MTDWVLIIEGFLKQHDFRMVTANGNYIIWKQEAGTLRKTDEKMFTSREAFLKFIEGYAP